MSINKKEEEISTSAEDADRYSQTSALISKIIHEGELGYVYIFPDKRLYRPVREPLMFVKEAWGDYEGEIGIYLHIPYCRPKPPPIQTRDLIRSLVKQNIMPADGRDNLCGYCNLFTTVAPEIPSGFLDSIIREIDLYKTLFQGKDIRPRSLYFGGGSSSLLEAGDLHRIVEELEKTLGKVPIDKERSIECIPDSVDYEKLEALYNIGFNRVSIGVQTFDETVLHYTGRNYDPQLGVEAVKNALDVGFANVNVDLIVGLPSSSRQSFMKDMERTIELRPHTVTLYQDATRPVTRFGKMAECGILPTVSQQEIYEWSKIADEKLRLDGYERKSLTCWARDISWGYQQEEDTYNGIPTIGIGPGARSYGPNGHYSGQYAVSTKIINSVIHNWREKINQGQFPEIYGYPLDSGTKQRARIILGLMSSRGADPQDFESLFKEELEALKETGMVFEENGKLKYTETGRMYSGALSRIFFTEEMKDKLKSYGHR